MSNKHWIKGMRRRARNAGLGRGHGNIAALLTAQERQQKKEDKRRKKIVQAAAATVKRIERQTALDREVARDKKRKNRFDQREVDREEARESKK